MKITPKQPCRIQAEKGVDLITVVIFTFVMAILAIAIMSMNVNQALSNQHQVERIKASELAKGAFWYNYMNLADSGSMATPPPITLDGKQYTVTVTDNGPGDPNQTTSYDVNVAY